MHPQQCHYATDPFCRYSPTSCASVPAASDVAKGMVTTGTKGMVTKGVVPAASDVTMPTVAAILYWSVRKSDTPSLTTRPGKIRNKQLQEEPYFRCGLNSFMLDSRRALAQPPKVLGSDSKPHLETRCCFFCLQAILVLYNVWLPDPIPGCFPW